MKNLFRSMILLIVPLVLFSCSKDKENSYEEKYNYEQFKELTQDYPKKLDQIFNYLVATAQKNAQNPTTPPVKAVILQKIVEKFNTLGLTQISNQEQLVMLLSGIYSRYLPNADKQLLQAFAQKQNPVQLGYLKKIIETQADNVEEFQLKIKLLMDALAKDTRLNETEKEQVYYIGAIAHHSYEYWAKNAAKWKMLLATLSSK